MRAAAVTAGVRDTSTDALSAAEFEESVMDSLAGAVCRRWHAGLLIEGVKRSLQVVQHAAE